MDLKISCGLYQATKQEKVYTQGQLKLTHIKFVILKSYAKFIYLTFMGMEEIGSGLTKTM